LTSIKFRFNLWRHFNFLITCCNMMKQGRLFEVKSFWTIPIVFLYLTINYNFLLKFLIFLLLSHNYLLFKLLWIFMLRWVLTLKSLKLLWFLFFYTFKNVLLQIIYWFRVSRLLLLLDFLFNYIIWRSFEKIKFIHWYQILLRRQAVHLILLHNILMRVLICQMRLND
jgi:hypothetical protein